MMGCQPADWDPYSGLNQLEEFPLSEQQIRGISVNQPVLWVTPEETTLAFVEERERWQRSARQKGYWERSKALREAREALEARIKTRAFANSKVLQRDDMELFEVLQMYHEAVRSPALCQLEPERDDKGEVQKPRCPWPQEATMVVSRATSVETMRRVSYQLGASGFGKFNIIPYGPTPGAMSQKVMNSTRTHWAPPKDYPRPSPLAPRQTPWGTGIDETPATIQIRVESEPEDIFEKEETPNQQMRSEAVRVSPVRLEDRDAPEPKVVGDVYPETINPKLYSSFLSAAAASEYPVLPSVEMLVHRSKVLDDALMAAIERDRAPVKAAWTRQLGEALQDEPEALAWVAAAAELGALEFGPMSSAVEKQRSKFMKEFLDDPARSSVLGIYGEADDLRHIYLRDRMLMSAVESGGDVHSQLKKVLAKDSPLTKTYRQLQELDAVLHNPSTQNDLTFSTGSPYAYLFPPAHTALSRLPPEERSLDRLIEKVRGGEHSLALRPDSGWFDHQIWALEPLLTLPESGKLELSPDYKTRLEAAFRTTYSMRLETHIKVSLPLIGAGAEPRQIIEVSPALRVEPTPTVMGRTAESYRFLKANVLDKYLSPQWQSWDNGDFVTELQSIEARFGAWSALSRVDLGLAVEADMDADSVQEAENWLLNWKQDPAMARDIRFMVPQTKNPNGSIQATVVLGVSAVNLIVTYDKEPQVENADVEVLEQRYTVLVPVTEEVRVNRLLTREAFRTLADQHGTKREILAALKSL